MKLGALASKIAGALISLYSFIVMLYAVMYIIVMDTFWPFVIAAILVCPFWFWAVDKKWLHERKVARWLIRLGTLVAGCLIFTLGHQFYPYYRYMTVMATENVRVYFEDHKKDLTQSGTDKAEFVEAVDLQRADGKPEKEGDDIEYYVITAKAKYKDTATGKTEESKEIRLLFDRWSGHFFENMKKMQQYWIEKNSSGSADTATGSAVSASAVSDSKDSDRKELCRRYTFCSENCRYESNSKEGSDEGIVAIATGGGKTEYTYESLGLPKDGEKFLLYVSATEVFISVEKNDTATLWSVAIDADGTKEKLADKAKKIMEDSFGIAVMYGNSDVIAYFDASGYYREYDRKQGKSLKVMTEDGQLLTYYDDPSNDDEYIGTVVTGNRILLATRNKEQQKTGTYSHEFLSGKVEKK